jgi:hypothetical protein
VPIRPTSENEQIDVFWRRVSQGGNAAMQIIFEAFSSKRPRRVFIPLFWTVFLIAILALSGCNEITQLSGGSATTPDPGTLLFHDDFSDPSSGWRLWDSPDAVIDYKDGTLQFLINQTNYDYWSLPGKQYGDVVLAVDTALAGGPTDNDFGIICRMQDEYNFYAFLISSDGYGGIIKVKDGLYQVLNSESGLEYGDMIQQGQASNQLRVDCSGSTLTLYVNHVQFLQVEDNEFQSGDIGLIAGSYSQPGVDIRFDNFYALTP